MRYSDILESKVGRLADLISVKIGDLDADFWIVRRSSADLVGEPKKDFDANAFGIKVLRTDVLLPQYLYYLMQHLWMRGTWKTIATGTTKLVSIRASDILNLRVG